MHYIDAASQRRKRRRIESDKRPKGPPSLSLSLALGAFPAVGDAVARRIPLLSLSPAPLRPLARRESAETTRFSRPRKRETLPLPPSPDSSPLLVCRQCSQEACQRVCSRFTREGRNEKPRSWPLSSSSLRRSLLFCSAHFQTSSPLLPSPLSRTVPTSLLIGGSSSLTAHGISGASRSGEIKERQKERRKKRRGGGGLDTSRALDPFRLYDHIELYPAECVLSLLSHAGHATCFDISTNQWRPENE